MFHEFYESNMRSAAPTDDLSALCRVCLKAPTGLEDAVSGHSNLHDGQPSLYAMLSAVCSAVFGGQDQSTEQGMPDTVCLVCRMATVRAYKLYEKCVESNRRLEEIRKKQLEKMGVVEEIEMEDLIEELSEEAFEAGEIFKVEVADDPLESSSRHGEVEEEEQNQVYEEDPEDLAERTCKICSQVLKKANMMNTHIRKAHPKLQQMCDVCNKIFRSYAAFQCHKQVNCGPFNCVKCALTFPTRNDLVAHLRKKNCTDTNKKAKEDCSTPHICKECGKSHSSDDALNIHMWNKHPQVTMHCDTCNTVFLTLEAREEHKKAHESGQFNVCPACNEGFPSQKELDIHLQSHSTDPFKCTICGKRYTTKGNLKTHLKMHQKKPENDAAASASTDEQTFICETCGKSYTKSSSLYAHVFRHHTATPSFECQFCELKFVHAFHLRRHMLTHTDEKPHKCTLCGKKFRQAYALGQHVRRAHLDGGALYNCDRCEASFGYMAELREHYKQEHIAVVRESLDVSKFRIEAVLKRRFEQEKSGEGGDEDQ